MAFVQVLPRRLASWIAAKPDWDQVYTEQVSLVSPADSMWRLAAHHMQPEILRSTGMLALGASVPSAAMVWWAVAFTVLTLLYAIRAFRRRAL